MVRRAVELLVSQRYSELASFVGSRGLPRKDVDNMREYLEGFQVTLILPPEDAYEGMDFFEVEGSSPRRWCVDMQLWTVEEGESDLFLSLDFTERGDRLEAMFRGVRPL